MYLSDEFNCFQASIHSFLVVSQKQKVRDKLNQTYKRCDIWRNLWGFFKFFCLAKIIILYRNITSPNDGSFYRCFVKGERVKSAFNFCLCNTDISWARIVVFHNFHQRHGLSFHKVLNEHTSISSFLTYERLYKLNF